MSDGFLNLARLLQSVPETVVRLGEIRLDPQGLLVVSDGFLQPTQSDQGDPQVVVCHPSIRILRHVVAPECFLICIETAPFPTGHSQHQQQGHARYRSPMPTLSAQAAAQALSSSDRQRNHPDDGVVLPVIGHQREVVESLINKPQYWEKHHHKTPQPEEQRPSPVLAFPPEPCETPDQD